MYLLIKKQDKTSYIGKDRKALARASGISSSTLKYWSCRKMVSGYYEDMEVIFCKTKQTMGKKGGMHEKY